MNMHTWWLYCVAVFFFSGIPGPNMLHITMRSIQFGVRQSLPSMLGCMSGLVSLLIISAAGLGGVMLAFPSLFEVIRYLGILYLVYLGVKAWRGSDAPFSMDKDGEHLQMSAWKKIRSAFIISASNPKMILFAAAFFPQFIDTSQPQAIQFLILIFTFVGIETFWYTVYGFFGSKIAERLIKPRFRRAFNRFTGSLFVAFGLALLRVKP